MGLGAVITEPGGMQHLLSITAEGRGCNNEAEARAMLAALAHAKQLGAAKLCIHTDSRVVADQLADSGASSMSRIAGLFEELRALLATFESARLVWLPRHRNAAADALARAAVGLAPKATVHPAHRKAKKSA